MAGGGQARIVTQRDDRPNSTTGAGSRRFCEIAGRSNEALLVAQGLYGMHLSRTPRRYVAGRQRHSKQHNSDTRKRREVCCRHAKEQARHQSRQCERRGKPPQQFQSPPSQPLVASPVRGHPRLARQAPCAGQIPSFAAPPNTTPRHKFPRLLSPARHRRRETATASGTVAATGRAKAHPHINLLPRRNARLHPAQQVIIVATAVTRLRRMQS